MTNQETLDTLKNRHLNYCDDCAQRNDCKWHDDICVEKKEADELINNLQQAINELTVYKKSFEKSCSVHIHTCIAHDLLSTNEGESGNITYVEEFENEILEQVRKELEND